MSRILDSWYERAAAQPRRVLLADVDDPRPARAAAELNQRGLVEAVSIDQIGPIDQLGDPAVDAAREEIARRAQMRGRDIDFADPLWASMTLVAAGFVDACVAGATRSTADVLRAALGTVGLAPDVPVLSSCFLFVLSDGRPIVYGDCGVVPDPDPGQLASIALASAATFAELVGDEPRVAMLSFSTKASAGGPSVDKVRAATALVRDLDPDLAVDGELQFDAAWDQAVAHSKAPGSPVAGSANVFVFPNLDAGNIAYKITERIGGAQAFGPLLQGLGRVVHDLSRGCSSDDIVNVSVIAALQAQSRQV